MPMSARNASLSASSRSAISASIAAHTATTGDFSLSAYRRTASRCGLFSKPSSFTFATYIAGFAVIRQNGLRSALSSSDRSSPRTALP
ncbi:hypothetical protein DM52_2457 [Burkholderia mallei]|nr:hypothetical protein DM52_2457 [Burkholderia mallei]